jgi:hypothetical protein
MNFISSFFQAVSRTRASVCEHRTNAAWFQGLVGFNAAGGFAAASARASSVPEQNLHECPCGA